MRPSLGEYAIIPPPHSRNPGQAFLCIPVHLGRGRASGLASDPVVLTSIRSRIICSLNIYLVFALAFGFPQQCIFLSKRRRKFALLCSPGNMEWHACIISHMCLSFQLVANSLVFLAVNVVGLFVHNLMEHAQRRAFLDTR